MLKPTLFIFAFRRRLRPRASDTAGDAGGDGEEGLFGGDETRSFTVDMILRTSCRILIRERRKIRQESDPQKISRSHRIWGNTAMSKDLVFVRDNARLDAYAIE